MCSESVRHSLPTRGHIPQPSRRLEHSISEWCSTSQAMQLMHLHYSQSSPSPSSPSSLKLSTSPSVGPLFLVFAFEFFLLRRFEKVTRPCENVDSR